jgi:hypothetical protein
MEPRSSGKEDQGVAEDRRLEEQLWVGVMPVVVFVANEAKLCLR